MNTFSKTSRLLVGVVATVTFAVMAAVPASAAPTSINLNVGQKVYVALGDSYAEGVGADEPLTENSYPAVLGARKGMATTNLAKTGATTSDVIEQLKSAEGLLQSADLVTLTVGGNDLNVAGIANACVPGPTTDGCKLAIATAQKMLTSGQLFTSMVKTLKAVRVAAPHAQIVVTGYPLLFDPSYKAFGSLAQQINAAAVALNVTIRTAVLVSQTPGRNLGFASVVVPFLGHGIGCTTSDCSWIRDPGHIDGFHPTTTGYLKGYYPAIAKVLASAHIRAAKAA